MQRSESRIRRAAPPEHESQAHPPVIEPQEQLSEPEAPVVPSYWGRGALLNVRNTGTDYTITLHPEEYDPKHPERAMRFPHSGAAQDFVSKWYMRENRDPRAIG